MEIINTTKIIFTDNDIRNAIRDSENNDGSITYETLLALREGAKRYFEYQEEYDNYWERWGRDNNYR